jgi:hypothetical protein
MGLDPVTYKSALLDISKLDSFRGKEMNAIITRQPELSIVVTARNDNHGGNFLRRMQIFVNGLLAQFHRYQLRTELILVEWNPPPDQPRFAQALKWPDKIDPCVIRIIEVSPELHRRFKYSDRLPLFQMIGKNVGIRRARGRFILATNSDILFSNEMVRFLASGRLRSRRMYRVDRYDVPSEVPESISIDEQLTYCCQNIIRINSKDGTRVLKKGDSTVQSLSKRPISLHQRVQRWIRGEEPKLHTNACGDFTLMAREHWLAVRGYAEFEMYSFKIDGLLCYAAHYIGARQTILKDPIRIYHIEHSIGSGWTPGLGGELLFKRLSAAGIPRVNWEQYVTWITQMIKTRQPIIFNENENWGLANESLPEVIIAEGVRR